jgi:small-conductance mechanosensitive channel
LKFRPMRLLAGNKMKGSQKTILVALVALLLLSTYALIRTGREDVAANEAATSAEEATSVDQTTFLTAQALAHMPTTAAELRLVEEALQLGDQDMDLAFASAVLDATRHPAVLSAEAKKVQARLQEAEDSFARQQAEVTRLTAAEASANPSQKDALGDQLDLAKAQLELAQDEVDDGKQDLIRAGGDARGRIQAMVQEHEAASHASDATKVSASPAVPAKGLIEHYQRWYALHQKQMRLWRAKNDTQSSATMRAAQHDSLDRQLDAQKDQSVAALPDNAPPPSDAGGAGSRAALKTAKQSAADRKSLAALDKRIDVEKRLAAKYGQWIDVVAGEQRAEVNGVLRGVLVILAIAIGGLLLDHWLKRILGNMSIERRRVATLRSATRVMLQIGGVLVVLLIIFGPPTELGTFLGLAGAGLTVALKDFIISFIGWFVLMGKNGIRLGDWVEINGVTGEVVELGMFRTVLLETGNWTDSGHPTGRRVTFTNSFAVEGHYFNFSTSGQWLWDELKIFLPSGQDPYPIIDAVQQKVVEATSESAQKAEQEWKRSAVSRDMGAIPAAPALSVRPVIGGTEVSVRYIASANERSQLRARLNHAAVDLLGAALPPKPESDQRKAHGTVTT